MKLTSAFLDSINHECLMSEDNVMYSTERYDFAFLLLLCELYNAHDVI